jgi:hypothetical protein
MKRKTEINQNVDPRETKFSICYEIYSLWKEEEDTYRTTEDRHPKKR